MHSFSAVATIAYRDFLKFIRDRARILSSLLFPFVFIGVLGGAMNAKAVNGANALVFIFTGVLAQTLFQSASMGLISLIDDRESDFSQEIFVAPISRYAILFGKIAGESLVALVQGAAIVVFGLVIGIRISLVQVPFILVASIAACLVGGAFGLLILVNLRTRRAAEQVFPLLLLPQFFLAGVFLPIQAMQTPLKLLSLLSPMRYAVDFMRGLFYPTSPTYSSQTQAVVLLRPEVNLVIMTGIFAVCLLIGTHRFVTSERNR